MAGGVPSTKSVGRGVLGDSRRTALALLAFATMVAASGLAAGGTAGALLGAELTGADAAAGLPLGFLVVGSSASAVLIARLSMHIGRGYSLAIGYAAGVVGAVIVVGAAAMASVAALLIGSTLLGAANAAIFLTRYAAAEIAGSAARGRAIGAVLFGIALGAILGSLLLGPSGDLATAVRLPRSSGLYLIAVVSFTVAAVIVAVLSRARPKHVGRPAALLLDSTISSSSHRVGRRQLTAGLLAPGARSALVLLATTNFFMVAVMTVAPVHLAMRGMTLQIIGVLISVHVAGMFVPSPLSGWLADRAGPRIVAASGGTILICAGIAGALLGSDSTGLVAAVLALLGVGWNFGVVAGSALLTESVTTRIRSRAEGIGEVAMGLAAAIGAPAAGLITAVAGFAALWLVGAAVAVLNLGYLQVSLRRVTSPRARTVGPRSDASELKPDGL
jgi:MFS family permease